jgi:uncharacterized OsmC-like protein
MKRKTIKKIILAVAGLLVIGVIGVGTYWFTMPSAQRNILSFMMFGGESYDNYTEYKTIDYRNEALVPTTFEPVAAVSTKADNNSNIMVVTEMVKNENSKMLKKGNVQTIGVDDYNGWYVMADEGAAEGLNPYGPSPLSYYTAGLASNLHTQILKAAEAKGVKLNSVKVEVLNNFRWDNMMAEEGAGFLDLSSTNIIIESSESEEVIQEIINIALNSWTAGEALKNETEIEPRLVVNGDNWSNYRALPGTTKSDESYVGDLKVSQISESPKKPDYLELAIEEKDEMSFDSMSNMQFQIYAISESAENNERPYLKKITLSTPTEETWEFYSDEFMGENDKPLAPTSLEYFTLGTALCLTSQTTLVSAMLGLDYTDYRVENQTDYRQENVNSTKMVGYTDTVHSYIVIESEESRERLETFYNKSLSLCFAGEGLKNKTDMDINLYLNGTQQTK